MGCDIHLHIEVKLRDNWEHYGVPSIDRRYRMFEKMAGVRGEIKNAIVPPKGLPGDMTALTKESAKRWESDGHSYSWLDVDEICQLEDWLHQQDGGPFENDLEHSILNTYLFGNSFTGLKRYPGDTRTDVTDVRFVFWFDC